MGPCERALFALTRTKWSIPTEYRGTRFRSKLEADTAAFLDAHGIAWAFEPEGYRFADGVCYLPDFVLPEIHAVLEVKGVLTDLDLAKLAPFVAQAEPRGYLTLVSYAPAGLNVTAYTIGTDGALREDRDVMLVRCGHCGRWGFSLFGDVCPGCDRPLVEKLIHGFIACPFSPDDPAEHRTIGGINTYLAPTACPNCGVPSRFVSTRRP